MTSDARASVTRLDPCCRLMFRGNRAAADLAGGAFGVLFPDRPCRAEHAGDRAALWLGRDEWLLLAPSAAMEHLTALLAAALETTPHAIVDVSDASMGLEIHGPAATEVLAAGCPLDLDIEAFPVDMCTRTLYGKAEIVLWRKEFSRFRIDVRRSFLPYIENLLIEVLRE